MTRRPDIGETETGKIVRRPRLTARLMILAGVFLTLAFGSLHARPLDGFAVSPEKGMTRVALPQKQGRLSPPSGWPALRARVERPGITPAWERKGQKAIFHGPRHKYHSGKRVTARARIRLARMLEFRPPRRTTPPPRPPRLRVPRRPPPGLRASPPRRVPRPAATARPRIAPSTALQVALQQMPGSLGLGVELLPGPRPVYSVKLKTGNRIHRVLVDAMNGRILNR